MSRSERVLLISADAGLRERVARAAPAPTALACSDFPSDAPTDLGSAVECWIDLDTAPVPPPGPFARHVYFAARGAELPRVFPSGLLVAKPPTQTALSLLWAEAMRDDRTPAWRLLPTWLSTYQSIDLEHIQNRLVEHLPRQLGYRKAALYLRPSHGESWLLAASSPVDDVRDLTSDAPEFAGSDMCESVADDHGIFLPLRAGNETIAVLKCSAPADNALRSGAKIQTLLDFCGRALQHALLFDRADRDARFDSLTGLYNRRGIEERLQQELRRAARYQTALSVLLADLDGLKQINDCAGHAAGDDALRHAAARMQARLRETDYAGRIGGDEFLVILPGTSADGARLAAERILEALRLPPTDCGKPSLSASIGGAEAARGVALAELIAIADEALYLAKREGRGCVRLVESPTSSLST